MLGDYMDSKGFTIVELVAILLVLAAITFISFSSIKNLLKSDNDKKYTAMVEDLCYAGKSYISANRQDFDELDVIGGETIIQIDELIAYGSVNDDAKNPKTGESIMEDSLKFTVLQDYSLDCQYIEN